MSFSHSLRILKTDMTFLFKSFLDFRYSFSLPDGEHQNQIAYILCSQRWRSPIQSTKTRPGADCGSDHELLIAKS